MPNENGPPDIISPYVARAGAFIERVVERLRSGSTGAPARGATIARPPADVANDLVVAATPAQLKKDVSEANDLGQHFLEEESGRRLVFAVVHSSSSRSPVAALLWKSLTRVLVKRVCVLDAHQWLWEREQRLADRRVSQLPAEDPGKLLHLRQFYKVLLDMRSAAPAGAPAAEGGAEGPESGEDASAQAQRLSLILPDDFVSQGRRASDAGLEQAEECSICLDASSNVVLAECSHSFCQMCIEEWRAASATCPMCRGAIDDLDDAWVVAERPDAHELAQDVHRIVKGIDAPIVMPEGRY